MKLRSISVKNFKSLKDIECKNISGFHTFIGRNSLGKSTIFESINLLHSIGSSIENIDSLVSGSISDHDDKAITVDLVFDIDDIYRKEYFFHYFGFDKLQAQHFLSSDVLKLIKITLKINVYGAQKPIKIHQNQVFISHMETFSLHGKPINLVETNSDSQIYMRDITNFPVDVNLQTDNYLEHLSMYVINQVQEILNVKLYSKIIMDIRSNLKNINPIRETQKNLPIRPIENSDQVSERGDNMLNLMGTMFMNQNVRYHEIEKFCLKIFPDLDGITPYHSQNNEVIILIKKKNLSYTINLKDEGSGLEQLLVIIWKIATSNTNTIWMLDEPELHLHPGAEKALCDFLRGEVLKGKQILVATHSMVFIHKSLSNEISLLLPNEGFTIIKSLNDLVLLENIDTRNIVYRALDYDPAFALELKTIVMVEGKTDQLIIQAFAKTLEKNSDDQSILFIPIGNKKKMEQFSPILIYAFLGKTSIIILDNDNENPDIIRKKILQHATNFQKNSGINQEIINDTNFYFYPKEVYSIEYYLLKSEAIARAGGDPSKIDTIQKEITTESTKSSNDKEKPKTFLSNLWANMKFGHYHETESAVKIASEITKGQLESHPEIIKLIDRIYN